ncbi:MAG TPA: PEP-CTERM sorting domain-containing protein [Candidatus Acidoferrales bacterium]
MRRSLLVVAGLLSLILMVPVAQADEIDPALDPQIIIRQGSGTIPVTGLTFSFTLGTVDGEETIDNQSSQVWTTLTLTIFPGAQADDLPSSFFVCTPLVFFTDCTFLQMGSTTTPTIIFFFGGTGVPVGQHFTIEWIGFPEGAGLVGVANVPEPGTLLLMLSGAGAMALRRRWQGRTTSA